MRFSLLVQQDYGYRLFVDDLPSATIHENHTHYEQTIPLGYVPDASAINQSKISLKDAPYKPVAIFNHLEIKIKVHPTAKSSVLDKKS